MARARRILAVASGGGHWIQLLRLAPAWDDMALTYVTTHAGAKEDAQAVAAARGQPAPRFYTVTEANRWQKLRLLKLLLTLAWIVLRTRPDLVVTTGAAPGYFALRLGGLIGAKTIWVDSIANAEELSLSGRMARKHATHCLSQWPDVARDAGVSHHGAVL